MMGTSNLVESKKMFRKFEWWTTHAEGSPAYNFYRK